MLLNCSLRLTHYRGEPPWPRGSVLGHRPPGFEFRILCLKVSVISLISPCSGGSPGPIYPSCAQKCPKAWFIPFCSLLFFVIWSNFQLQMTKNISEYMKNVHLKYGIIRLPRCIYHKLILPNLVKKIFGIKHVWKRIYTVPAAQGLM